MSTRTLGEVWKLGWRVRVRCLLIGRKPKTRDRTTVWCDTFTELDMKTLVWTRGEAMPLDRPNVGALAFKRSGDPNLGQFNDATIIKSFGEVPANLDEL